ncbi:LCCL domain-containing protein [Nitrospira sp. Kam-Ns4a]
MPASLSARFCLAGGLAGCLFGAASGWSAARPIPALLVAAGQPRAISWETNAVALRGQNGQQFSFACPQNGTAHSVWGTDVYTDDSSICTAAVHAGRITVAAGGTVTIEILPGQPASMGTGRNGVVSGPSGPWVGSYVVVGP